MRGRQWAVLLAGLGACLASHATTPPSIEDFAARSSIEGVAISPDGRYLAMIEPRSGRASVVVVDRQAAGQPAPNAIFAEPEHYRMTWCHWATNTRFLCGFQGSVKGPLTYNVTRLAAADADGRNIRVLIQNEDAAQGQFQDRIISWNPGPADTVLIEADEGRDEKMLGPGARVYGNVGTHALPAVFELNVVTGALRLRQHARDPIRHWIADLHGEVRLGWGFSGTVQSYFARLSGDSDWRRLSKFEVFSRENHFEPIAISGEDANKAYAFGAYEGRRALWLIDLTDKEDPVLVFSHPVVDVQGPILGRDGHLVGVRYDPNYPMTYFTDERMKSIDTSLKALEPGKFVVVTGSSRDEKVLVARAYSNSEASQFLIFDTANGSVLRFPRAYPDRDPALSGSMRSMTYPARDGTPIPAYLSAPPGVPNTHLPLIVMPHGGPIARDTWNYFFLREFLVSRGYAVLQMNFRGSSGYGDDWFYAAHQDWGGLTYDDVVDGARWAIQQNIADPRRMCIVGWSFGGYLALLGAQRNPDLFRCSVDIAGVSDLSLLIDERYQSINGQTVRRQIGTDAEKLKRNSPRLHAADFSVPLLMLHGDADAQVPIAQSTAMDDALKRAQKPHRFVMVPDADHPFSDEKHRAVLLHEIEPFLAQYLLE